jgi:elongation factor 1-alpha
MGKRVSLPASEERHIEFKERLLSSVHLKAERRQHLATQMKSRLSEGNGSAVYLLGVTDDGEPIGLSEIELEESLAVLRSIATEVGAVIDRVERYEGERGTIAKVIIKSYTPITKRHVVVAVAGHVNHGKSTLIACLMTGQPDDGRKWLYLDTLPHEIERNLSADLHFALLGFRDGRPILMKNPLDKLEKIKVASMADKLVSFVDTVGHEPWLRTTIRGLVGQEVDYGLLIVAADDGPTHITREHLGIMLALGLPIIVCISKIDRATEEGRLEVRDQVSKLLKKVGRVPLLIRDRNDIELVIDKMNTVVPIIETSSVTLHGYDHLYDLLSMLPSRTKSLDQPFMLYIDRVYNIEGVGSVVSGSIMQGKLRAGSDLLIGPDPKGVFRPVKVRSIEMHYARVAEAEAGYIVGIAIRGISHEEIRRGMVLCDVSFAPRAVWSFKADLLILTHPTRVASGYEPVLHCHTISHTVKLTLIDKEYLRPGEQGEVIMEFKYSPWLIREGDKFVIREGRTKGIGHVTKILRYA